MDLTTFKLDIDELVDDFTRENSTEFTDLKRVWFAKKFSYIYEASPRTNSVFFMQSLFAHSIEIRRAILPLLSLRDSTIQTSCQDLFVFSGSATQGADAAKKLQEKNFQIAYEKLLSNTEIEDYVHMNLGVELGLESFKKMSTDYVKAKEEAIKEASKSISVEDIKHIAENARLASDAVDKLVKEWDSQKEIFYKQTGLSNCGAIVTVDDEGFAEVERLLDE